MAYTRTWDETSPAETQRAKLLGQEIREVKADLRERLTSFGAGPLADRPTPDGTFGNANFGVTYQAIDTGQTFRWNGSIWVDITPNVGVLKLMNLVPVALNQPITGADGVQLVIPANTFQAGDYFRIISGVYRTAGTDLNAIFGIKVVNASVAIGDFVDVAGSLGGALQQACGIVVSAISLSVYGYRGQVTSTRNAVVVNIANPITIKGYVQQGPGGAGNNYVNEFVICQIYRL